MAEQLIRIAQVRDLDTTIGSAYAQANAAYAQANTGSAPKIASIVYPGNDTAANNIGGQTIYLTGSGFLANSNIYINGNAVPSKSFISASNIAFTTPNLTNGLYPIYVVNYDGATAISVPGIVISGEPTWNTAAGSLSTTQAADGAWSYSLSANGDAPITYALASGSSLPTGVSLASNGLISGTITSPPSSETTYTFSVVASDAQYQDATRQFTVTVVAGDLSFANTTLLLHADGTNNGTNHSFLDSSNNNITITRYGNASQGAFSPFSQTGWSNYFNGSGQYLNGPTNNAVATFTGDFTIEAWFYFDSIAADCTIATCIDGGPPELGWQFRWRQATPGFRFVSTSAGTIDFSYTPPVGSWNHVALSRSGTSLRCFVNGTQIGTTGTLSGTVTRATTNSLTVGGGPYASASTNGYLSNVRIVNGTALYTANFTPPTSPLTAISNTSLLTCQSNRFIDNSSNAFSLSLTGSPTIQAFSPFAPTAAYATANVGGSMYLDGTGDWLSAPDNAAFDFGSGNFTIEFWYYPTVTSPANGYGIFAKRTSEAVYAPVVLSSFSGALNFNASTSGGSWALSSTTSSALPINCWTHVAIVRNGTTVKMYINGTAIGAGETLSGALMTNSSPFYIGLNSGTPGTQNPHVGYISDFRILKGTALYTTNFTAPTSPLTNIANTSLLLNHTNAQIFDQTAKNVLEAVGSAKVSTSVYKYGTGSIDLYSNSNDSYLFASASRNVEFTTGDFTIEGWIYPFSTTTSSYCDGNATIFDTDSSSGTGTDWWVFHQVAAGFTFGTNSAVVAQSGSGLTANQWSHFAITRSGSTIRIFTNGTLSNTATYSTTTGGNRKLYIGKQPGQNRFFKGYLDDLRITKGYARYTSAFTVPAAAFQNK
jgi:hypothetical protein